MSNRFSKMTNGLFVLLTMSIFVVFSQVANAEPVKYIKVSLPDTKLSYKSGDTKPKISTGSAILSYGDNWKVKQLKPYLYHMKHVVAKDFYWAINTSHKKVWRVKGGTFGQLGGLREVLKIKVESEGSAENPTRFFLNFPEAGLVFHPDTTRRPPQLGSAPKGEVLSYCRDWEVKEMKSYLYHIRQRSWKNFYWKVNTSRSRLYKVTNGTFGKLGGKEQELDNHVISYTIEY